MSPVPSHHEVAANATRDHKVGKISWISRCSIWVPALTLVASSLMGCAAETTDSTVSAQVDTSTSAPSIFGGTKDDDGEAQAGVVALRVGTGGTFELCSGALIAPNVV